VIKTKTKLEEPEAKLTIKVYDREGNLIPEECLDACVFTTVGKQQLGDLMRGDVAGKKISHLALGTDGTAPTPADTALYGEQFREAIDSTSRTGTAVKITTVVEYGEANGGGSVTYQEAGLFNDPTAGQMFVRANFPAKVKNSSVQWTLEFQIQF